MSVEKVLVYESVYDEFLIKLVVCVVKLKVGDIVNKDNVIGFLINDC